MKISIYTLGCKVNQYESQAMQKMLESKGHEIVPFGEFADACIINTCSVTAESDRKSRQVIRRARKTNPNAFVAVCGCYSQTHSEAAGELGADLLFGTNEKEKFIERIDELKKEINIDEPFKRHGFENLPSGGLMGRTRAMLKVQDGCVNFCTYCIIPYARGTLRSLPQNEAADEAEKLYREGYRELVLTGIEISSYGVDLGDGSDIVSLTKQLCETVPDMRIHLGSLEPRTVDERFCKELRNLTNLNYHFHLSMQSGSDSVLKRMGRKYGTERYYESVELLRKNFPGCAITTDMITGFPGETEEEFSDSLDFIRKCYFADMHIFPYSSREGTKAAAMPDQVPKNIKAERASRATDIAAEMKREYLKSCIGKTYDVLFETFESGIAVGHAENYAEVEIESSENLHGKIRKIEITGTDGHVLIGRQISDNGR